MHEAAQTPGLPDTSLIICSRNRAAMLSETVASILQGGDVPTELIVVDQSDVVHQDLAVLTTDRPCKIRYIRSQTRGLSRARNQGIERATFELIVFADDDVLVTTNWFRSIVSAAAQAGPDTVVTGRVLPADEGDDGFVPSTKDDPTPAVYKGRVPANILYTLNSAMHKSLIQRVGEFDVRMGPGTPYPGAEDNDFCFRVLEAGFRVVYAPQATLYHRAWRTSREYLPLRWNYGRGQGAFYAKHLSLRDRYMLRTLSWELRARLRRSLKRLPSQPRSALGDVVYALGILSGAFHWLLTPRARLTEVGARATPTA